MNLFSRNAVSVTDAATALENGGRLIDVRTAAEWKQGRAVGAEHYPLDTLANRMGRLDGATVYVICRSGNRSGRAAAMLRRAGIDAKNIRGGMLSWQRHQLPVAAAGSNRRISKNKRGRR